MHFPLGSTLSTVLIKNDPRFPILFHSLGPGNGEEVSKLNLTLFDPGSVVTLPFFFFFYKIKKKITVFGEWRWHLLGNVSVADKKGKALKVTSTKFCQCFGAGKPFFPRREQEYIYIFKLFISIDENP